MATHWLFEEDKKKVLAASAAFQALKEPCGSIRGCSNRISEEEKRRGYGTGNGFGHGAGAEEESDGSGR